ncbi:MAG TPA: phosphoribosylformylglycinamidine cyclo-ligase [Planctomycetaceae bacterium]|nr:phosphoribosylformylglycinamidine cyclo-ligase [Planctomycetaceae bacterium]
MPPLTYRSAGVDLELYDEAMARLPRLMQRTHGPRVLPLPDGFAGLFRLRNSSQPGSGYDDPVLVSGTDGVGTKLKVAQRAGRYNTVGIDLVAMCVNDCLCVGAEPLFFLDYLAVPKDDPDLIAALVEGVSEGCRDAGAALLGGETAVLPDIYAPGDYDMAGFCTGVVERSRIIDGATIRPGDVAIGIASSGLHSNGYSLIRKAVFDVAGLGIDDTVPELGRTVADVLLEPTKIYVRPILAVLKSFAPRTQITGLAHITGGGLRDNIERILPHDCRLTIDRDTWPTPPVFTWLQGLGDIEREEMFRVFNMGIGFVVIARPDAVAALQKQLTTLGLDHWQIGDVRAAESRGVDYLDE